MQKKSLNEKEILLVLVCKNKEEMQSQVQLVEQSRLLVPNGWNFKAVSIVKTKNLAAAFNDLQKSSDAKYKIFLTEPIAWIDRSILINSVNAFFVTPKTGMIGLFGSEMPLDGDYTKARVFYGVYSCSDGSGGIKNYYGKDALYLQPVHMIDSGFFATSEDLPWDEKVGEDFLLAAQCCNFRSKGYDVGIPYQENQWVSFTSDARVYNPHADSKSYERQLKHFQTLYTKKYQPLVSVLIPAYNQPKFFKEALDSILNQTYKNIEIVIGDDSTNEDIKNLMKPYLKKYSNIKYNYHEGKSYGGARNMLSLLNDCSGEYVNYLLHDDLFYPEKLSRMMDYYVRDLENTIGIVTSARNLVDENSNFMKRKNPWHPHNDAVMSGREVGRKILFTLANFLGELSTVLFKKNDVPFKDPKSGERVFAIGCYCGIGGTVYGDLDAWLEILRKGKSCVFIHDVLSAFRQHAAQNTFNPYTRTHLPLDALGLCTISWLNNLFFNNIEEYKYCCNKWTTMAGMWFIPFQDSDSEDLKALKNTLLKMQDTTREGDYDKILDASINFILERLPKDNNPLTPLIRKNEKTGRWEKANDGLTPCYT